MPLTTLLLLSAIAFASPTPVPAYRQAQTVAIITIEGEVDSITASSFKRRLFEASDADAIVIELNTPGGGLLATLQICYEIKNNAPPNTVAWIHPHAFSAGTIIALSCREIVAANNSTFGDAAPISAMGPIPITERAKIESPILTEVVDSARRNHYDEHLVEAFVSVGIELWLLRNKETNEMVCVNKAEYETIFGTSPPQTFSPIANSVEVEPVFSPFFDTITQFNQIENDMQSPPWDPDFAQQLPSSRPVLSSEDAPKWELIRQVVPNDRLLTLKPAEATQYGLVRGIVSDDAALALWFGAQEVRRYNVNWSEKLVRILVSWPIRIILIAVFLVCVFVEFVTGASGAFSAGAVVSIALLIGAPWLAGLADVWEIVAVGIGLVLIAFELLVIPGTGFTGFVGVACLFAGIIGTFISDDIRSAEGQAQLLTGLGVMLAGGVLAAIASWFLVRFLGGATAMQRLVLEDTISNHGTMSERDNAIHLAQGEIGTAVTDLRPSGRISIGTTIFDATTTGQWISKGATVRIMHKGMTIEVEEVPT
jgi:membrane-bound serine protease (ClpP class)